MNNCIDLIATCWTIGGNVVPGTSQHISPFPLEDRVRAAAAAGYTGIGLWHGDLLRWREGRDYAALRQAIERAGLKHIELEYLAGWFDGGEERRQSDAVRHDLFAAAEALGARHIKVMPPFGNAGWPTTRLIDEFGELCKQAARYGLLIALEMIPYSDLPTLESALAVAAGADADNGGLLVDIWHVLRSGASLDAILDLPARYILAAEINDADLEMRGHIAEDSMRYRKLCGEGAFDVPLFITRMTEAGYRGPYGVEILSDTLRQMPLEQVARRTFDTARAQFATPACQDSD
ncbi:sugar phosphate isomerase/epimerase family protein [Sphingomonas sp. KC8]|uniref:sugar phosphate isomerase/epimerase family protein n=1 Tax=Sphingomonas sp. KC8 TaxID=1030157 RepID=UPI0002E85B9C|nr:sugar phosphate isomerase/epimerase [Sphingomonas sp. KC8]ARS28263.1 hypothetical protein KC8_13350 [Sphingomonas sp. KC8]